MTRARWLIAALLCLPLPASAQSPEWKTIACTAEFPDIMRGFIMTIYFSDSGRVYFNGTQYTATVTNAEIWFCDATTCYTISRITGRFSALINRTAQYGGSCIPEGAKPKF